MDWNFIIRRKGSPRNILQVLKQRKKIPTTETFIGFTTIENN